MAKKAAAAAAKKVVRRRNRKNVEKGQAHIQSTFNNTIVTLTDTAGNALLWGQAQVGWDSEAPVRIRRLLLRWQRKPQLRLQRKHGLKTVEVFVKGPGAGRESAIRALQVAGLEVTMITDVTPVPHNGCRPPKRRRVELGGIRKNWQ